MSLLNITNDGLPNVLVAICGALVLEKGKMAEADLMQKVAPQPMVHEQGKMVRQTLNRWVELGLFVRADSEVAFSPEYWPTGKLAQGELVATVRRASRRCALDAKNNPLLWARESAKAADLTRSLCLLLAQDVYRTSFSELAALEREQILNDDLRLVQNDTRTNGLKKWAHFLGFVRQADSSDIDPTLAVRESISEWMPCGQALAGADFLAQLAEDLPVLDGGRYRNEVEEQLDRRFLFIPEPGQASQSLSRALLSLRASGELSWEARSDAIGDGVTLTGRDGVRSDLRFTHVTRTTKESA